MSDTNGIPPPAPGLVRKRKRDRLLANPGRRYAPSAQPWGNYPSHVLDGTPVFTWLDVPRMMRDPQVRYGLRMLRAPFQQVTWRVRADRQAVADYADAILKRFWAKVAPRLLIRYFCWGYSAAVLEFAADRSRVRLKKGKVAEPRDVTPRVWRGGPDAGAFAGFHLRAQRGGSEFVGRPHALWFAGNAEMGPLYDRPRLADAFEPWLEKNGRNGAKHLRRLFFRKQAMRGGRLYYPLGTTDVGTPDAPDVRANVDLAREQLEYEESGSQGTYPNTLNGDSGRYAWDYVDPAAFPDAAGVREYPQDLDTEILVGLGIPPEVLEAQETGGWSGRMVPAMAYFGSCDELAALLIDCFDEGTLRDLVAENFGAANYEVEPVPLAETLLGKGGGEGGGGKPAVQVPPTPGGGDANWQPYRGPHGGQGSIDPAAGRKRYGASLSHDAGAHEFATTQVQLGGEARSRLLALAASVADEDLADDGREADPHVTVRYGLEVDGPAAVRPLLEHAGPVRLWLGGVSVFRGGDSGKPYDVLKVDVDSPDLRHLNRLLATLPHTDTHPEYVPHATIAYVKAGLGEGYAERMGRLDLEATADRLVFSTRAGERTEFFPGGGSSRTANLSHSARPTGHPLDAVGDAVLDALGIERAADLSFDEFAVTRDHGKFAPKGQGEAAAAKPDGSAVKHPRVLAAARAVLAKVPQVAARVNAAMLAAGLSPQDLVGGEEDWERIYVTHHADLVSHALGLDALTAAHVLSHLVSHAVTHVKRHLGWSEPAGG